MKTTSTEFSEIQIGEEAQWTHEEWLNFIQTKLIDTGFTSWPEAASVLLGALNPPQVGTSLACNEAYKRQFPKRKCWEGIQEWFYRQLGRCPDCKTYLNLTVDHIIPKAKKGPELLDNLTLRCNRCNTSKRHANGGKTLMTTESALMFLYTNYHPRTYEEYEKMCRAYGLTMSSIRIEEAWARQIWIEREKAQKYNDSTVQEAAEEPQAA